MDVTLTGAGGFIGQRLAEKLRSEGHRVNPLSTRRDIAAAPPCDAVVHLAGEPVAQRWTEAARQRIRESRIDGTRRLVDALARLDRRPSVLVSASAVGYYGSRGDEVLDETAPPGQGFLADVCVEWEREAQKAEAHGIRVVRLRIGVVLDRSGGALRKMLPAFKTGTGGRLGSGRHWMAWIHLSDLVRLISFALSEARLSGAVNAVAPNPVRNAEFTRQLCAALYRPAVVPVPPFALKLLFGEMASVLLDSQRAVPQAAQAVGFRFEYPELGGAFREIFTRR
jgi:uncharacterized protein (TIGR01777 family)